MEFIFRSVSNKKKKLKNFNFDLSNFTIAEDYNSFLINDRKFSLFFCYKKKHDAGKYFYSDEEYLILANHKLKNINQIKELCGSSGKEDAEIILDYYKKFNQKLFEELKGEFSILIYKKKTQKIISGIDRFGINHIFTYSDNNCYLLSTRISMLLSIDDIKVSLNETRLKDFLELKISSHEYTFYNEILKIKPSHYITYFNNTNLVQTNYFNFANIIENKFIPLEKSSQNIKEALIESITTKGNKKEKMGVLFSGGLDSSSIISILGKHFTNEIYGISAIFKNLSIEKINLINESSYQNNVYDQFKNVKKYQFDASDLSILEDIDRYLTSIGEPFFFPNLYITDISYKYAHKKNISIVFNGNDGDTIVSHGHEVLFYYFMTFKWIRLFKEIKQTSNNRNVSKAFIFKRIIIDLYFKPFLAQFIKFKIFRKHNDGSRKIFIDPKKNHINIIKSTLHQDSIYKHSCLAFYYGIEEEYPFYDADFISCSIRVPSRFKFMQGMPRFILRDAMKEYVPTENLNRITKSNLAFALCINLINKKHIIESEIKNMNKSLLKYLSPSKVLIDWESFKKDPYKHTVRSNLPSKILTYIVLNRWLNKHLNKHDLIDNNLTNS